MCEKKKHLNINDGLLDTKCFDHKSVFKETFEDRTNLIELNTDSRQLHML